MYILEDTVKNGNIYLTKLLISFYVLNVILSKFKHQLSLYFLKHQLSLYNSLLYFLNLISMCT